jgi:hypothetical protein
LFTRQALLYLMVLSQVADRSGLPVSIWKACVGVERLNSTVALIAQAMLETGNGQSRWLAVFMKMFLFFVFVKRSSTRSIGCEYHGAAYRSSAFLARLGQLY